MSKSTTGAKRGRRIMTGPLKELDLEVLRLAANGHDDPAIVRQLGINRAVLDRHWRSIYGKLNAANRDHAVAKALQRRIVERSQDAEEDR